MHPGRPAHRSDANRRPAGNRRPSDPYRRRFWRCLPRPGRVAEPCAGSASRGCSEGVLCRGAKGIQRGAALPDRTAPVEILIFAIENVTHHTQASASEDFMSAIDKIRERIKQKGLLHTLQSLWKRYVYFHRELLWLGRDLVTPVAPQNLRPYS